jgi:hypothetical protein
MIKNMRSLLAGVLLMIVIIMVVIVLINVNPINRPDLLSQKEKIKPFTQIEIDNRNNQADLNPAIESKGEKEGQLEDQLLNMLVQKNASLALYTAEQKIAFKKNIESLIEYDKKHYIQWDLPEDVLSKTSTDKLFLHFIKSPMIGMIATAEDLEIAVQRLLISSNTLREFYTREDMAEGAMQMYREYDISPQSISDEYIIEEYTSNEANRKSSFLQEGLRPENILKTKIAYITMRIMYADGILLSPQFFSKLKGHKREFLTVLYERYEKISKLREVYGEDFAPALRSLPDFFLMMSKNLDEEFYTRLSSIKLNSDVGRKQFYEEVKNYLEQQNEKTVSDN